MKGVLLTVSGNDFACAKAWGAEAERAVKGENPSGFSELDRYFKNFCGQIAWLRWCRLYGLRCRYYVEVKGRSVHRKFHLYERGELSECEIKTAGWADRKDFMVPKAQVVNERALYVGMRLLRYPDTDMATITEIDVECCGIISGKAVAALDVVMLKVLTRRCPHNELAAPVPVRSKYDQGGLELVGRAVELEPTPPFRLT